MGKSAKKRKILILHSFWYFICLLLLLRAIKMCRKKLVKYTHARKLSRARTEHTRSHHMVVAKKWELYYIQNLLMVTIWLSVKIITKKKETKKRKIWKREKREQKTRRSEYMPHFARCFQCHMNDIMWLYLDQSLFLCAYSKTVSVLDSLFHFTLYKMKWKITFICTHQSSETRRPIYFILLRLSFSLPLSVCLRWAFAFIQ